MRKFLVIILFTFVFSSLVFASGDERAVVQEKDIAYKNWKLKKLGEDKDLELRKAVKDKKLVMVVYFAPWCGNWRNEAPLVMKLYDKYKADGFDVIGVSEYGTREEVKAFFGGKDAPFIVVTESEKQEDRDKTTHYQYRQLTGDTRKWGSPWNIFLEPAKLNQKGDVLTEKAWIVQGELIEDNIEPFIREKLGLPKEEQKKEEPKTSSLNLGANKKSEVCEDETKTLKLKKP